MTTNFQLYVHTVEEYKRFAEHLPVKKCDSITDNYTEEDYVGIQVRLMLLRKYFSGGKNPPNVYLKRVISEAQSMFPGSHDDLQELADTFDMIEIQQIEHILSDGTKLNLYTTIEDTVYGLYLHADEARIARLGNSTEAIRFCCIRKYVLEIEKIVLKLYDILKECGVPMQSSAEPAHCPILYLGDPASNTQSVTGSPYWKNLYGRDAADNDLKQIGNELSDEEKQIIDLCLEFLDTLKQIPIQTKKLKKCIHPATYSDWGNFTKVQEIYNTIPSPGISTKVRYNQSKDTAYVRIFLRVENPFYVDTPHIFEGVYEISLGKWFGKWKIYSFGGHLDSVYETRQERN